MILKSELGRGGVGCSDSLPPFLPYSFSTADPHMQSTKNRKVTKMGIHNLAESSDIHMCEENVFPCNPGIYNTN